MNRNEARTTKSSVPQKPVHTTGRDVLQGWLLPPPVAICPAFPHGLSSSASILGPLPCKMIANKNPDVLGNPLPTNLQASPGSGFSPGSLCTSQHKAVTVKMVYIPGRPRLYQCFLEALTAELDPLPAVSVLHLHLFPHCTNTHGQSDVSSRVQAPAARTQWRQW